MLKNSHYFPLYTYCSYILVFLCSSSPSAPFQLYRISYLYFTLFGALVTIVVALVTSLLLRESDLDGVDTRLLTPFVRRWMERRRHRRSEIPDPGQKAVNKQETKT